MSEHKHILIAGCGYLGQIIARYCLESGHSVTALKRDPSTLPRSITQSIEIDMSQPFTLNTSFDAVIFCAAAGEHTREAYHTTYVEGLRHLIAAMGEWSHTPQTLFVSSTSVYGQTQGEEVDEEAKTQPRSFAGEEMLEAEDALINFDKNAILLRLAGIYGPDRIGVITRFRQNPQLSYENPYTNRIHSWDAARAALHLLHTEASGIFNGVDSEPALTNSVRKWLAKELAITIKDGWDPAKAAHGHKRVLNTKLLDGGFEFLFPSFREGYHALLQSGDLK